MTAYDRVFDRVFTPLDPERAHHLGFAAIRRAAPVLSRLPQPGAPVEAMGIVFPNRLGLAAGFDKNAVGIDALSGLGFGHVEIGTVTALPQQGNEKPRLFRLPADRAIVNRMGFNNDGAEAVARRLATRALRVHDPSTRVHDPAAVLGINIGKSKVVPEDDQAAVEADYEKSTGLLAPFADYLVVNVSSPNTPGLRSLQAVDRLGPLLASVRKRADQVTPSRVPLLVKIAPDLADEDVIEVAQLATDTHLDGIIATNTTISRDGLLTPEDEVARLGAGGLSGAPVRDRALAVLELLRQHVPEDLTLIGVGGISTPEDARVRLDAGATLVQAYSGFVYGGPLWARRIAGALR
ncbi:MAG: quinone-dependent dihydroorotate dehydrogenase [Nocardioides sp.]|jgi:dihydroorotate dehydrogenase